MSNDRPNPIESKIQEVRALLEARADQIASVATDGYSVPALIATVEQAIRGMPALTSCTTESFVKAAMDAAALGLRPDKRQGAFVPQRNKESMEVQFRADWKGLVFALKAQGCVRHIYAHVVRQGDSIGIATGSAPYVTHKPSLTDPLGSPILYYSVAVLPDGSSDIEWMTLAQVQSHRNRYSPKKDKPTPWDTEFDEMGRKTVMHRHIKRLGLASDALGAVFGAMPEEIEEDPSGDRGDETHPQSLADLPLMKAAPPSPVAAQAVSSVEPPAAPVPAGSQLASAAPSPAGPAGPPSSGAGPEGTGQPDSPAPEVAARKRAIDKARRACHAAGKELAALRGTEDVHAVVHGTAVAAGKVQADGSLKDLGHAATDDAETHARKLVAWQAIHAALQRELAKPTATETTPDADPLDAKRAKLIGLIRAYAGLDPDEALLDGAAQEYAQTSWDSAKKDETKLGAIWKGLVARARTDRNPAVAAYLAAQQNGGK